MRATHFLNVPTFIEENPEQSGGRKSAIETEKLSMKKMISWNVNGLRACLGKGFLEYLKESDADIFCIQESKLQEGQVDLELPGYHQYWNYAEKKGYFLHPADTGLFAMYAGFGMRLCGGCRYAEYAYSGVGLLTDAPKPRHATADDFARDESDVRWGRGLLEYAAEPDESGICLCFPDGALAYGEKRGDALTLSFSQGLCREHLSALCRDTACGTVKMRLNGDDTPYLMGYNLPFENLHIDFTFE